MPVVHNLIADIRHACAQDLLGTDTSMFYHSEVEYCSSILHRECRGRKENVYEEQISE